MPSRSPRDRVRIAEAADERVVQRQVAHRIARHGVHQLQPLDVDGRVARGGADTELVECVKCVRSELDARPDLAELRRTLQHDGAYAGATQPERGGETTDTAAGDDDRQLHR